MKIKARALSSLIFPWGIALALALALWPGPASAETIQSFGLVVKNDGVPGHDAASLSACLTEVFSKSYIFHAEILENPKGTDRFSLYRAGKEMRLPRVILVEIRPGAPPWLMVRHIDTKTSRARTKSTSLDGSWGGDCDTAFVAITGFFLDPPSPEARRSLTYGEKELEKGNKEGALAWYQHASEADPKSPVPPRRIAKIFQEAGDAHAAMTWYSEALERWALDPWSYLEAANIALGIGEREQAIRYYQFAINAGSPIPRLFNLIGRLYHREGRYALAADQYLEARALDPGDVDILPPLVASLMAEDRFLEAAEHQSLLQKARPSLEGQRLLAELFEEAEEFARAAKALDALPEAERASPAVRRRMAQALLKSGQIEKALPLILELTEANPDDVELARSLGRIHFRQKHFAEAIAVLQKAREGDPNEVFALRLEALARELSGDIDGAMILYEEAFRHETPVRASDAARFLDFAAKHGRLNQAGHGLRTMLPHLKRDDRRVMVMALGERLSREGRVDEALTLYEETLPDLEDHAPAMLALGTLHLKKGNVDKAVDIFELAALIFDEDRVPHYAATRLHAVGEFKKAKTFYQYAHIRNPRNVAAVLSLAEVMMLSDDDPDWVNYTFHLAADLPKNPAMTEKLYFMEILWGMRTNHEEFARSVLDYCLRDMNGNKERSLDLKDWREWIERRFRGEQQVKARAIVDLFEGKISVDAFLKQPVNNAAKNPG